MAAGVNPFEIDGEQVRPVLSRERRDDLAVVLAGRENLRELSQAAGPIRRERRLRIRGEPRTHRREVRRRFAEFLAQVLDEPLGERGPGAGPRAANLVEGEAVGDLETLHPLGRIRGVPPDEPRGFSEFGRDVPESGDPAAGARDRRRPAVRADLDEVEHAVVFRFPARRDRRPDDRREERLLGPQGAERALPLEPLERRQLPLRDEPINDLEVRAVDPDQQDARRSPAASARGAAEPEKRETGQSQANAEPLHRPKNSVRPASFSERSPRSRRVSAGESGAAYCRGSAFGGRLPASARGGRPRRVKTDRR